MIFAKSGVYSRYHPFSESVLLVRQRSFSFINVYIYICYPYIWICRDRLNLIYWVYCKNSICKRPSNHEPDSVTRSKVWIKTQLHAKNSSIDLKLPHHSHHQSPQLLEPHPFSIPVTEGFDTPGTCAPSTCALVLGSWKGISNWWNLKTQDLRNATWLKDWHLLYI